MKSVLSGILTTIMITVTVGVPVFRHTCFVSDKTEVTVLEHKECCDPETTNSEASVDFRCCTMQQYDTSFSYETVVKKSLESSFDLVIIAAIDLTSVSYFTKVSEPLPVLRPPPLANRDLHNKIQQYLI